MNQYKLLADEIVVWRARCRPSQEDVNRVYNEASNKGWNGVTLDLFDGDIFVESLGYLEEEAECGFDRNSGIMKALDSKTFKRKALFK